MSSLLLLLAVNTLGYTIIYIAYTFAAKTMPGRVVYTAAVVIGTILGSTLGQRWFK